MLVIFTLSISITMCNLHHHHHHHHHHVPGLLQSSVLLRSSLLGDSLLVTKFFRLSVYFVRFRLLLLVPQIFPLNICFSIPSALFIIYLEIYSCLFLMVLSRDLLYPAISITSWFDFFSVHDILIILLMCHNSAASSLLFRSFVSVQHHIHV